MINLLPTELKEEYRYARRNRRLARWGVAVLGAIFGLAVITGGGVVFMNNSIASYKTNIASAQAVLASQNVGATQKQVSEISNNLKLMVAVLSKEILFSRLLARLGGLTPPNAILTNLSISQTESAIDITAQTGSYDAATQLQINLAAPNNQIFSKVDLISISCASPSAATNSAYPCTVTLRALLSGNNQFLFINGQKAGAQ